MLSVSFAMTADAFADGSKTETRRFWRVRHASKFKPGTVFCGIDKDFRAGGVRLHEARVVSIELQYLRDISEESFVREGGTRYWASREAYIAAMGGGHLCPYVLRFEHVSPFGRYRLGSYDEESSAEGRLYHVARMDLNMLRWTLAYYPDDAKLLKTVRLAVERRIRKLEKEASK